MIRRPVPWPNGAKVAVAITFDMDADSLVHIEHPHEFDHPRLDDLDAADMARRSAVPRILEAYRRFGLKQTFFVPAWCIEHYPRRVEAMVKDGHEVGFHGYIHEAPNALSRDEEHYWMQRSIAVIEKHTGKRPRGNRSPLYNFSIHTADLLVEEGFSTTLADGRRCALYLLKAAKGELVELPSSWALDDWPPYVALDRSQLHVPDHAAGPRHGKFHGRIRGRCGSPAAACGSASGILSSAAGCRAG